MRNAGICRFLQAAKAAFRLRPSILAASFTLTVSFQLLPLASSGKSSSSVVLSTRASLRFTLGQAFSLPFSMALRFVEPIKALRANSTCENPNFCLNSFSLLPGILTSLLTRYYFCVNINIYPNLIKQLSVLHVYIF